MCGITYYKINLQIIHGAISQPDGIEIGENIINVINSTNNANSSEFPLVMDSMVYRTSAENREMLIDWVPR